VERGGGVTRPKPHPKAARLPKLRLLPALIGAVALLLLVKLDALLVGILAPILPSVTWFDMDRPATPEPWPRSMPTAPARLGGSAVAAEGPAASGGASAPAAPAPREAAQLAQANAVTPPRPQAVGEAAQRTQAPREPVTPPLSPEQAAERALLENLRARRTEIEAREQAVATREMVLAATEKRLAERIEELAALQQRLESTERALSEREEAGWRQMVKLYEGMKPRDAAAIFEDLEMPVLLRIVERMGERKAAPVIAAMRPERARLLTTELARHRARPAD
jgi:flagellar motility protein MotE (MotC chaperone)